ncbi:Aspartate/ornithine carbamoyltransferase, carbamoyl-P binding domain-containing protein [Spironucleus salmonicida]|uniref:Aspartate/ornithine carbamoyltransferase, carbamoyl-P binding domain-containing protein n=1 Tax=Spironucleus salmonicida TaxID=348837 RepID=V6LR98_9EUKA|nr:Aspartate/ornithine carbamoyltransferase, carbamoyl-P binding domain-containing protein [Spironucleus salmonicida]|eukprot:EST43304.1 Hypothetical protein SS50377_16972 [Spironucleus salmonicida]
MAEFLQQEIEFIKNNQQLYEYQFIEVQQENIIVIQHNGELKNIEISESGFLYKNDYYPTFENLLMNTSQDFQNLFFQLVNEKLAK